MRPLVKRYRAQPGAKPLSEVKNVLAVCSAKGGVGKSTTAINIALSLQKEGAHVGILDADIYGPSIPLLLGAEHASPESTDKKTVEPVVINGLQTMSIGYLVDQETAMVWRGPMASKALQQILYDTQWKDLDYLIVDMPPGTGDLQLTLAQKVPLTGALMVTTPQTLALADVMRGIAMFNKVAVSVLGLVENMAAFECPHCEEKTAIFGEFSKEALEERLKIPQLGGIPLSLDVQKANAYGVPLDFSVEGTIQSSYLEITQNLVAELEKQPEGSVYQFSAAAAE